MISKNDFNAAAFRLYDFCEYPAVRHKIESQLLDTPSHKDSFAQLHNEFLKSDIVDELYEQQDEYGGGGEGPTRHIPLVVSKNYLRCPVL